MIDKYELIECLEWLQDKGFIQFKGSAKVDMVEEYLSNCGGENAVLPDVSVNEADWRKLPMHERDSLNANWRTNNLGKNSVVAVCEIGKHDCRFLIPNGNRCDYIYDCKHKKQTEL